jgi:hypothetical protein
MGQKELPSGPLETEVRTQPRCAAQSTPPCQGGFPRTPVSQAEIAMASAFPVSSSTVQLVPALELVLLCLL